MASVLARSANAAVQLADAQSECKECAHAQSEREATAPQSAVLQGQPSPLQVGYFPGRMESHLFSPVDILADCALSTCE